MSSLLEKLQQKEQQKKDKFQTIFWKPKPGDILIGTVTKMGHAVTVWGEQEFVDIRAEDGEMYTVFLTSFLKQLLNEERVQEGDKVAIKFVGIKTSSKGRGKTYKDFVVVKEDSNDE